MDDRALADVVQGFVTARRGNANLKLCCPVPRIRKFLEAMNRLKVFDLFDSEAEGVRSFQE
jgi:anti-anti-sigma regulatory factor